MIAALWKALGFWGSIAAGLALALLVAVGVQTWRLHSAQTDVATLTAAAADWRAAESTNLGTIKALRDRLQALADARRLEKRKQAAAVAAAQKAAQVAQTTYERRRRELEKTYARDPNAGRWAADAVPADVLRDLPDAD